MATYSVIVWDNSGTRFEEPAGDDIAQAKAIAKTKRHLAHRTVKIARAGNALYHWSRSVNLTRNHWTQRATADEWIV